MHFKSPDRNKCYLNKRFNLHLESVSTSSSNTSLTNLSSFFCHSSQFFSCSSLGFFCFFEEDLGFWEKENKPVLGAYFTIFFCKCFARRKKLIEWASCRVSYTNIGIAALLFLWPIYSWVFGCIIGLFIGSIRRFLLWTMAGRTKFIVFNLQAGKSWRNRNIHRWNPQFHYQRTLNWFTYLSTFRKTQDFNIRYLFKAENTSFLSLFVYIFLRSWMSTWQVVTQRAVTRNTLSWLSKGLGQEFRA